MKIFLSTIILALSIVIFPQHSLAQSSCSVINSEADYDRCCPGGVNDPDSCGTYLDNILAGDDNQDGDSLPLDTSGGGTIGAGAPPGTGPQNGAVTTPGTLAPTPQGSSAALKSCNAITFDSLLDILIWLKCIIAAAIIPLIFTLAFLFFLWGMVMFIRGADDVKKREESKKFIYWGIIALTVMISVWGIIKIVNNTLGFGNTVPALQTDYLKSPETPKTP